jgi:hypothetical protein
MPAVGPDRFDDVEFRMLEQPEPPGRPRLRRWTLTALSAVLATGLFAGGASALTGDERAPAAKQAEGWESYGPLKKGRDCDRRHKGADRNREVRY